MKTDAMLAERKANSQTEKIRLEDKIELDHISFHYPDSPKAIFKDAQLPVTVWIFLKITNPGWHRWDISPSPFI